MIQLVESVDQLKKEISREIVQSYHALASGFNVNHEQIRGQIRAYEKVLDMLGTEVLLIAEIGGGVK